MSEPRWISKGLVLAFHNELLNRFGGSPGIRGEGLLDSALNNPLQLFHYESPSIHQLAASYAFGIIKNHPFIDGNKRTGFISGALFMEQNGYRFTAPETEAVLKTLALAAGELDQAGFAEWLEQNSLAAG